MQFLTRRTFATSTSPLTARTPLPTKVRNPGSCKPGKLASWLTVQILGGTFKLELFLPDDYPMTPPKIRFLTKIFHPNVDKLGRICLDVLKSAHMTITALVQMPRGTMSRS